MEVPANRKRMDNRLDEERNVTEEFQHGCFEFVRYALEKDIANTGRWNIRCPCKNCKCLNHHAPDMIITHLCGKGFMRNYYHWTNHGEPILPVVVNHYYGSNDQRDMLANYEQLAVDAARPDIVNYLEREGHNEEDTMTEDPNKEAQIFLKLLKAAQSPLWDGCDKNSVLSASLAALSLKS